MTAAVHGIWRARPGTREDLQGLSSLLGEAVCCSDGADGWWVVERCLPTAQVRVEAAVRHHRDIGHPVPQAWFRLGWSVHASADLGLYQRQRTLLLGHDLTGTDELAEWALSPALQVEEAHDAWRALLKGVLRRTPSEEDAGGPVPIWIATLPGVRDGLGRSPVWQGLGRHFHAQDLGSARRAHGASWEPHVAPLLPRHLLYAALLPQAVQEALGQCAPAAEALRRALLDEGFQWREHVDIIDGGPVLERWPEGR
jgi:arginine N-succinyltransferase